MHLSGGQKAVSVPQLVVVGEFAQLPPEQYLQVPHGFSSQVPEPSQYPVEHGEHIPLLEQYQLSVATLHARTRHSAQVGWSLFTQDPEEQIMQSPQSAPSALFFVAPVSIHSVSVMAYTQFPLEHE